MKSCKIVQNLKTDIVVSLRFLPFLQVYTMYKRSIITFIEQKNPQEYGILKGNYFETDDGLFK